MEEVFETGSLSPDSRPLLDALVRHGPYDLVYGPSGYGLPLVPADRAQWQPLWDGYNAFYGRADDTALDPAITAMAQAIADHVPA